jgi:DNA-directed RNA polymerase subunit RPC12/RpoP
MAVRELLDLTRGLNSLALVRWFQRKHSEKDWTGLHLFSGWGEPLHIPFGEYLDNEVINIHWGYRCPHCGSEGDQKDRWECPECGERIEPKKVHWGGIEDWKRRKGRLTYRYSAHPF